MWLLCQFFLVAFYYVSVYFITKQTILIYHASNNCKKLSSGKEDQNIFWKQLSGLFSFLNGTSNGNGVPVLLHHNPVIFAHCWNSDMNNNETRQADKRPNYLQQFFWCVRVIEKLGRGRGAAAGAGRVMSLVSLGCHSNSGGLKQRVRQAGPAVSQEAAQGKPAIETKLLSGRISWWSSTKNQFPLIAIPANFPSAANSVQWFICLLLDRRNVNRLRLDNETRTTMKCSGVQFV